MCVFCFLLFFFFCFSLLEFAVCFYFFVWKLRMPSLIFCFVVFFSHFFLDLFHHSNKVTEIVWIFTSFVCFYCLKSGKCIIISVCLFSQNLDPLPSLFLLRPSHLPNLPSFSRYLFLCSVSFQIGHTKMDFSRFFKVQIRLDSFVQKLWIIVWESSSICFVVVVVVGSTSLVVLDVVALRFSANAAACVYWCVCELVMSACLWLSIVSAFRSVQILFSSLFFLNCNNCNRSGECVCIFSLYLCGDRPKNVTKKRKKKAQSECVCVL